MAFTTVPTVSAGDKYPAASWNTYIRDNINDLHENLPGWVSLSRVTSDFVKNADTTLEDVTGLSFSIAASEVWLFLVLGHHVSNTSADLKVALTVPSGAVGRYAIGTLGTSGNQDSDTIGSDLVTISNGNDEPLQIYGTVVNSTNAGTVQLQAAQNSSHASNTTIYTNSWLAALRIS